MSLAGVTPRPVNAHFLSSAPVTGVGGRDSASSARHIGRRHLSPIIVIVGRRLLGLGSRHRSDTEGRETLRTDGHRRVVVWAAQPVILGEPAGQRITPTRPYKAGFESSTRARSNSQSSNLPQAVLNDVSNTVCD
jgi:hypothetical protein